MSSISLPAPADNSKEPFSSQSISNEPPKPKWWHYFFAGEIAGMAGCLACHPFDTAKIKIQMLSQHKQSTLSFMRSLVINDGILSLYRGVAYPFFGIGILFSITFGVNGVAQSHFIERNQRNPHKNSSELSMFQITAAGTIAGTTQSFFRTPIERVKTWSQTHNTSTARSTMELLSTHGLRRGLWYGIIPTLVREVPQFAVYYPIYESTCMLLNDTERQSRDKSQVESWKIFVSGASAGVGCWIVTYPIDVVMTRILAAPPQPNAYKNMLQTTRNVYKQGGCRGFWNGLMPTIYRAFALHSVIFLVYERTLESMQT